MYIMNGIQNFLLFVNDNWTNIAVIIGLIIAISRKAHKFLSKSTDEKIEIAKSQIREIMLKMITDAEIDFDEWAESGTIKRSQVIGEIFEKYPVLSKAVNQNEIIDWIDAEIKNSLKILRKVVSENKTV